jgi:hypothetical protein
LGRKPSFDSKNILIDQFLTQANAKWLVDSKDGDRRAANGCPAGEQCAIPAEVPRPFVPARMKQRHELACHFIDSRQIRSFFPVARETGPSEISSDRGAAVLPGNDVLDFKSWPIEFFGHVAILAQSVRALPDESCQGLIHARSL